MYHIHLRSTQPPTKPSATFDALQLSYRGWNAAGKLLCADCNIAHYQLCTAGIPYNEFLPLDTDVSAAASACGWIGTSE